MLFPLFKPSRIAWTVIAGFFPLRFWARTLAAMNWPWVSLGLAVWAASKAVSNAAGVVPSLDAMPVKLSGILGTGGVAGFAGGGGLCATVVFAAGVGFGGVIVGVIFGAGLWAAAVAEPPSAMSRTLRPRRDNGTGTGMRCLQGNQWVERASSAPPNWTPTGPAARTA